jgi:hypothetical protein
VRCKESSIQILLVLIPLTEDSSLIQKGGKYPDSVKIGDKSSGFDSLLRFRAWEGNRASRWSLEQPRGQRSVKPKAA